MRNLTYFFKVLIFLPLVLLLNGALMTKAANFSANWGISKSSEGISTNTENYIFNFDKEITSKMHFGGTVNYSKSEKNTNDFYWQETINPNFYYSIVNDYFSLYTNYNYYWNNFSNGKNFQGWNLSSNFRTEYKKFSIYLFGNTAHRWSEGLVNEIDVKSNTAGITVDRSFYKGFLKGLALTLGYRTNEEKNISQKNKFSSQNYDVRVSYNRIVKKMSFGITQEWYYTKSKATYELSPSGQYKVEVPLNLVNGTFNNTLSVGDEFVVRIPSDTRIEGVDFYADYELQQKIGSNVVWDIYYSKDQSTWNTLAQGVTLPYDFGFSVSYPYVYIKFVVKSITGPVPNITNPKFVGFYYVKEREVKSTHKTYKTAVNFGIELPKQSYLSTIGGYELNDYTTEGFNSKRKRKYISTNLSIGNNEYFKPNLSYFLSKEDFNSNESSKVAQWGISFLSIPIKTLRLSYGYTNTKNWYDGQLSTKDDNFFVSTNFYFLPTLSSSIVGSYDNNEDLKTNENSQSYTLQISVSAELKENLRMEVRNFFSLTKNESGRKYFRRHECFLTWQVSSQLNFMTSQTLDSESNYYYSYVVSVLPTRKLRMNFAVNGYEGKDMSSRSFSSNIFWRISQHTNLSFSYDLSRNGGTTQWTWSTKLRYLL
ncbi:MAG: hypothetical protein GXO57_09230 [Thermodesulfobacteria bacterium]|nr:hypothetical protein [Thermodesulfobacteriota bacterium]